MKKLTLGESFVFSLFMVANFFDHLLFRVIHEAYQFLTQKRRNFDQKESDSKKDNSFVD